MSVKIGTIQYLLQLSDEEMLMYKLKYGNALTADEFKAIFDRLRELNEEDEPT